MVPILTPPCMMSAVKVPWVASVAVALPVTYPPDPSLPLEDQLAWYKVASHVLLLNVSERTRRAAAAEADKAVDRIRASALRDRLTAAGQ